MTTFYSVEVTSYYEHNNRHFQYVDCFSRDEDIRLDADHIRAVIAAEFEVNFVDVKPERTVPFSTYEEALWYAKDICGSLDFDDFDFQQQKSNYRDSRADLYDVTVYADIIRAEVIKVEIDNGEIEVTPVETIYTDVVGD